MKALQFSRNSWHYKLLNKLFDYEVYSGEEVDLCSYTWAVIGCIVLCFAAVLATILVSFIAVHTVLGIGFSLIYGMFIFTEIGLVGFMLTCAFLVFVGLNVFFNWLRYRRRIVKPDGFVKNAYKGMKEKYCARVTFDEVTEVRRDEGNVV